MARRKTKGRKTRAKGRKSKPKSRSKGTVPLDILEKRLVKLNKIVKKRGGYSY